MRRLVFLVLLATTGCAGTLKVVPGPGDGEPGVRFYAPAPYVWITTAPASDKVNLGEQTETVTGKDPKESKVSRKVVSLSEPAYSMEIVYLPDESRPYAVQWKSGWFGSVTPKFTLDKGWNLVAMESTINSGLTASVGLTGQGELSKALGVTGQRLVPGLYKLDWDPTKKHWKLGDRVLPEE